MSANRIMLQRIYDVHPPYKTLNSSNAWQPLLEALKQHPITLLYGSRDTEQNHAIVLRDFLLSKLE